MKKLLITFLLVFTSILLVKESFAAPILEENLCVPSCNPGEFCDNGFCRPRPTPTPQPSPQAIGYEGVFGGAICRVALALQGDIGKALIAIAIMTSSIGLLFGGMTWATAVTVSVGAFAIVGSSAIVGDFMPSNFNCKSAANTSLYKAPSYRPKVEFCVNQCPATEDCSDNNGCPSGEVCTNGLCGDICLQTTCPYGQRCVPGVGTCEYSPCSECLLSQKCCNNRCISKTECCAGACAPREKCCSNTNTCIGENGCCGGCGDTQKCCNSSCIAKTSCCGSKPAGKMCDTITGNWIDEPDCSGNKCGPGCPACPNGQVCCAGVCKANTECCSGKCSTDLGYPSGKRCCGEQCISSSSSICCSDYDCTNFTGKVEKCDFSSNPTTCVNYYLCSGGNNSECRGSELCCNNDRCSTCCSNGDCGDGKKCCNAKSSSAICTTCCSNSDCGSGKKCCSSGTSNSRCIDEDSTC